MSVTSVDRALTTTSLLAVIVFMFLPVVVVSVYITDPNAPLSSGATETTVGVGVILRAVWRRLSRAGAQNLLRVAFGTMMRTMVRTAMSRIVRMFIRSSAGSTSKRLISREQAVQQLALADSATSGGALIAIVIGICGTVLSFWGVMEVADPMLVAQLCEELPIPLLGMLAGAVVPLICLAGFSVLAGWMFAVQPRFATGIDGLLIQAYFTASGSFLPMTTDFEFRGQRRGTGLASAVVITLMLVVFAVLHWLAGETQNPYLMFLGSMFLTYAFVYAFPVQPLLGHSIWNYSKLLWFVVFLPTLVAFLSAFPDSLAALL